MRSVVARKLGIRKLVVAGTAMALVLAACGGESEDADPEPAADAGDEAAEGSPQSELDDIIAAAEEEGALVAGFSPIVSPEVASQLTEAFNNHYGTDIAVSTLDAVYPVHAARVLEEHAAGVPPSADFVISTAGNVSPLIEEGAIAQVDWTPALPEGTPEEVIQLDGHSIVGFSSHMLYAYNTEVVDDPPTTFWELDDPAYKDLVILPAVPNVIYEWFYNLREHYDVDFDELFVQLEAILDNGAITMGYGEGRPVLAAGERGVFPRIHSQNVQPMIMDGAPVEWVFGDEFTDPLYHTWSIVENAAHPNAALLYTAFLAGPEAASILEETRGVGNSLYPGSFEDDILVMAADQGLTVYESWSPEMIPERAEVVARVSELYGD